MKKMRKIGGVAKENTGRNGQAKGTQNHFTTPRSSYEVISHKRRRNMVWLSNTVWR